MFLIMDNYVLGCNSNHGDKERPPPPPLRYNKNIKFQFQVVQNMGSTPGSFTTPTARGGFGPTSSMLGSSQQGGPGNYNPPLEKSPAPRQGTPGSGQQLIKQFLLQQKQQEVIKQQQQVHIVLFIFVRGYSILGNHASQKT